MSYMNDGCDPFGILYIEYENRKTVKKEKNKPIERFTYNGCIIFDKDNRMEVWETVNFLNELVKENEQLKKALIELKEIGDYQYARIKELSDENEKLEKELFEARKDYILETYADNPIRRDEKLKALEKELEE